MQLGIHSFLICNILVRLCCEGGYLALEVQMETDSYSVHLVLP